MIQRVLYYATGGTNAEFGDCRLAPQQLQETLIFLRLEAVGFDEVGGDFGGGSGGHGPRL